MDDIDRQLTQRIWDIVAVATEDIDAVSVEVEERVAYIEGVVTREEEKHAIIAAVRDMDGLEHVVACLSTEHVRPAAGESAPGILPPAPVLMHYHSLS